MLFSITKLASRDVVVLDINLTNTLKQTIRLIDHVTHSVQAFSSFSIQALDLQDGCLKRPTPSSESQSRGGLRFYPPPLTLEDGQIFKGLSNIFSEVEEGGFLIA